MHPLYRFSHIGRPVDARYPTNRAALIIAAVVGITMAVWVLVGGGTLGQSAAGLGRGALLVFAAWALGRELAPDDNPAAFIGTAIAVVGAFAGAGFGVLEALVLIPLVRIVNRSIGPGAMLHDRIIVLAGVAGMAIGLGSWPIAAAATVAFALDSRLRAPTAWSLWAAVGCAALTVVALMQHPPLRIAAPISWIALLTLAGFTMVIAGQAIPTSKGDIDDQPLDRERVRGGMGVAAVYLAATIVGGTVGIEAGLIVWATVAGVMVGRFLPRSQQ